MSIPIGDDFQAALAARIAEHMLASFQAHAEAGRLKQVEKPRWCPHEPWPTQRLFLGTTALEAFYGGAAGGGKSDAILMAALQYVDVPGYSALILRRDFRRLDLPGAIMSRARQWLYNTDASWNGTDKRFTFPSGATLQFGYVDHPDDRFRYASSEFQFIGFDELTEFRLTEDETNPYTFLFSRLRKTTENPVPLRVRSASNPGNIGHAWVRKRFVSPDAEAALLAGRSGTFTGPTGAQFVPARIADNPAINRGEYEAALLHLPPVTRERLMRGDWSIQEASVIRAEWLRYFATRGSHLRPLDANGCSLRSLGSDGVIDDKLLERFATIDTAGTSRDRAAEAKGKPRSWSVCGIWDYWREHDLLFLRDVWRDRVNFGELKAGVVKTLGAWECRKVYIENAHFGQPLGMEISSSPRLIGCTVEFLGPVLAGMNGQSGDGAKLERATASGMLTRMENGRLFIPQAELAWRPEFEGELLRWTGLPDETWDQGDMVAYACAAVGGLDSGPKVIDWRPNRPPSSGWYGAAWK